MVAFSAVRKLALALPEVIEKTSYGTPAFRVRGKLFCRLLDDGKHIVVFVDPNERAEFVEWKPDTFSVTPHYLNHPMMLVRLETVTREELRELLFESCRRRAPKRLAESYDGER